MSRVEGPLPGVTGLFVVASVVEGISATGVAGTLARARLRHDAERAERRVQDGAEGLAGWAAGIDGIEAVTARAVCEFRERQAVGLLLAGVLPFLEPDSAMWAGFEASAADWPRDAPRAEHLHALPSQGGGVVAVAWSVDGEGALCSAAACRAEGAEAGRAVRRELLQMEFGLALIRRKAATGHALTPREAAVLTRRALPCPAPGSGIAKADPPKITRYESDGHDVVCAHSDGMPPGGGFYV